MKILFLYTKIDNTLRNRVTLLREHGAEVHMLSLLECKLHLEDETKIIDIESPFEKFEERGGKLRVINRVYKRKRLLQQLADYDLIDIYKCERSSLFLRGEIAQKCAVYFLTPSDEEFSTNFITNYLYQALLNDAKFILSNTLSGVEQIPSKYRQKVRVVFDPITIFEEIDKISEEKLFKAAYAMGIDFDKDIVYCDMSGTLEKQLSLIGELNTLPDEKKRGAIFIFHLSNHDLHARTAIKETLDQSKLNFMLIDSVINEAQKALLFKLSNISIILSDGINRALPISLYAKSMVYLYGSVDLDDIYKREKFFYEDFSRFVELESDENPILEDLLETNRQKAYELFSPEASIEKYIEVIKEI